ncbi:hypothetical protein C0Q70_13112 [Pomacea canaliculata]|uniref:Uncharacterized protein n=1 Tax=Pomacea canaliculata TaxID=400727 RepID=A0A2T7NWC9_POMCA|nr:hypothetical protein C0Q70_13112 [Pomacea canaliculata]
MSRDQPGAEDRSVELSVVGTTRAWRVNRQGICFTCVCIRAPPHTHTEDAQPGGHLSAFLNSIDPSPPELFVYSSSATILFLASPSDIERRELEAGVSE